MKLGKVLILGGDGYLGWPTAMYLAKAGYEITIIDNLSKRKWEKECNAFPLIDIATPAQRILRFKLETDIDIKYYINDVTDYNWLSYFFLSFLPNIVIHFAEQPSAPYSMINRENAVFSQVNNVVGTLNVLFAIRKYNPKCHLIKLGTMGEYGTPNIDIPEGFFEIEYKGRKDILPFPKQAGSFYHLSKVHDSNNITFACKIWGLRATDLHQGIVYGINTKETKLHPKLRTSFHYDEIFGTALNRFCVQAIAGIPLTIYGEGSQTRGFLNILDTLQCVKLAVENPAKQGQYRVMNQFTEVFSIKQLARMVESTAQLLGMKTTIEHIPNPRIEAEKHYYNPTNESFRKLGLKPHTLSETLISDMLGTIITKKDNINPDIILPKIKWGQRQKPLKPYAK